MGGGNCGDSSDTFSCTFFVPGRASKEGETEIGARRGGTEPTLTTLAEKAVTSVVVQG